MDFNFSVLLSSLEKEWLIKENAFLSFFPRVDLHTHSA